MLVKENIPQSVENELKKHLNGDGAIRIAAMADLDLDGNLADFWVLSTDKRILVVDVQNNHSVLHSYDLASVKEISVDTQIGSGFLTAIADGKHIVLARYSNAHTRKFAAVAKQLQSISKGEEAKPDPEALPIKCPKCGFPLEHGSSSCANCVKKHMVILRLLQYSKPHWKMGVLVLACLIGSQILSLVTPLFVRHLWNHVLKSGNRERLVLTVLAYAGVSFLGTLASMVQMRVGPWMGARIMHTIRMSLCEHLEKLSVSYYDKRQIGAVMTRVNQDTMEVQRFLTDEVFFFLRDTLLLTGIVTMMISLNWRLGLMALIPVPFSVLMILIFMRSLRRVFRRFWHRRSRFGAVLNDSLSGVRTVKAFAQEDHEAERLAVRSRGLMIAVAEAESTWGTLFPVMIFVMSSGTFLVWWFGGLQYMTHHIGIGDLMAIMMYVGMLGQPLFMVVRLSDWLGRVFAAAERVFEVMDTPIEQPETESVVSMPHVDGRVQFKNVTFGYDPHNPVLHNVDLDVAPGEMIGLVGHSGAGKSTTINLICRFYSAQEGKLLIDGIDIKEISLKDLRGQIGIVPQEPYLFTGTIAENIAYSNPEAGVEEIIRAAKAANAHDFIVNFPEGYETQLGERGQGLSGGEKQRIAIARAILHDPKILILDEATSSIDTQTEKQIQEALARLVKNRTTFAIAHRLSTLRNADRLLVLEHGKVAEIGTHDELMERKGTYFKLVEIQTELARIKAVDG